MCSRDDDPSQHDQTFDHQQAAALRETLKHALDWVDTAPTPVRQDWVDQAHRLLDPFTCSHCGRVDGSHSSDRIEIAQWVGRKTTRRADHARQKGWAG